MTSDKMSDLPPGWVRQFDNNYHRPFYVNTNENPPGSYWELPNNIPPQYSPPLSVPPPHLNSTPVYNNTGYPTPPATGGYNPGPGPQYQGGSAAYPQQPSQQPPSRSEKKAGGMGSLLGLLGKHAGGSSGKHSSSPFGPYSGQQQSYKPPKKHGGMGGGAGLALGAGAGLLGGLLVADAVDDAFDDGNFGGGDFGDDFGGGDFGDF